MNYLFLAVQSSVLLRTAFTFKVVFQLQCLLLFCRLNVYILILHMKFYATEKVLFLFLRQCLRCSPSLPGTHYILQADSSLCQFFYLCHLSAWVIEMCHQTNQKSIIKTACTHKKSCLVSRNSDSKQK